MSCPGGCGGGPTAAAAATVMDPVPQHPHLPPPASGQNKHADAMEAAFCSSQGAEMAAWDIW